jgi:hypothetical protein
MSKESFHRQPLLTPELRASLPPLYSQETLGLEAIALVKFFTPWANWTWYASEGSPVDENGYYDTDEPKVDYLFFGLVSGHQAEMGYFSLTELESVRGPAGLYIERDEYFKPRTLGSLLKMHSR